MGQRGRILLIDPSPPMATRAVNALAALGFEVQPATRDPGEHAPMERAPDAIVVDLRAGTRAACDTAARWAGHRPPVPVVFKTNLPSLETTIAAMRAGAADYVIEPLSTRAFAERLRAVLRRAAEASDLESMATRIDGLARAAAALEQRLQRSAAGRCAAGATATGGRDCSVLVSAHWALGALSGREREIVEELVRGVSTKGISTRLGISAHTVRNHVKAIFRKTGVRSRVALLARLAREQGSE